MHLIGAEWFFDQRCSTLWAVQLPSKPRLHPSADGAPESRGRYARFCERMEFYQSPDTRLDLVFSDWKSEWTCVYRMMKRDFHGGAQWLYVFVEDDSSSEVF